MNSFKNFWSHPAMLGYVEGILSFLLNVVLFGVKYWVGLQSGSVAILADAWHTLSDSLTSVIVILGFKFSTKPPDKKHPFGHSRAEIISSIIIGTLLAIVAFNFLMESIHRFRNHQAASYSTFAIIIFFISAVLKEGLAQFSFWSGHKIDSKALRADGWHHRSDAIASVLILLGIFLGKDYWWIDSVMGGIVSLLLFYATYDILWESISSLIGEEPKEEVKTAIRILIKDTLARDIYLHHLHLHEYGMHKELTFHIRLPSEMQLQEAHRIADQIEDVIRDKMQIETTIHVEPLNTGVMENWSDGELE